MAKPTSLYDACARCDRWRKHHSATALDRVMDATKAARLGLPVEPCGEFQERL